MIPTFPPRFRKGGGNGGTGGNVNFILQVTDIKVFRQLPNNILPATKRYSAGCRANFRRSSRQISSANRFFHSHFYLSQTVKRVIFTLIDTTYILYNPNFNYRPNNTNGRWDFFQSTNWVNEGTRDYTVSQSHNVSINGGKKELNYLVSAGYYTKNGILKYGPDSNDRYNLRMKINSQINDHISLNMMASYEGKFLEQNPNGSKWILNRLYRVRQRQPNLNPEEDINESPYNGDLQVNAIDLWEHTNMLKVFDPEVGNKPSANYYPFFRTWTIGLNITL